MKKFLLFISFAALFSCGNSDHSTGIGSDSVSNSASGASSLAEIKFEEEVFDFGRITQGEKVSHSFSFRNTGKESLIISGASGSCGCTVPEYPKEPIPPGGTGKIDVVFNSEGKAGMMEKTVTVVTNCEPATKVLRIKADIIVPETGK
jgi:hypothetical protein